MNYSDYNLDQLMYYSKYREICDLFLKLAKDDDTREKLISILFQGGYKDYNPCGDIGKNNPIIDIKRRISLAYLLIRNPNTFDQIVDNKIVYFHGTNATALPGIIKNGINSVNNILEQNEKVNTGEVWSRIDGKRSFISFTDVLDLAEGYSSISSKIESKLSFPVVFGTTKENILNSNFTRIISDYPEVGVRGNFPIESINCIMVPTNKIEIVKNMISSETLVLPMDDVQDRFYSVSEEFFDIYIDKEKYNKLRNDIYYNDYDVQAIKRGM